ncbi:MAG: transglycosylase domain-containing protein, partial [Bacillota bacterium]
DRSAEAVWGRIPKSWSLKDRHFRWPAWASRSNQRLATILLVAASGVLIAFLSLLFLVRLPEPQTSVATRILDVNGHVISSVAVENRQVVPLSDISPYMQNAVVAIEDDRFYSHHGIDFRAILRAAWRDLLARRIVEGGSTITQQLVRGLYLSQTRTFTRKINEVLLTIKFESAYTKKEILEMYLNQIYYGQNAYGVQVAAETYFGQPARSLTLGQSAMLAATIRNPSIYNPFNNLSAATSRRGLVLDKMVVQGYITKKQADEAKAEPVVLNPTKSAPKGAPYFIEYVMRQVNERHPDIVKDLPVGGYTIETTLDLDMQQAAEAAFKAGVGAGRKGENGITQPQGALVAVDPSNGYIKAFVGGRDFAESQFNRAYQAKRQPGSSFKAFLYTAVLDQGYTAVSQQVDEPVTFQQPGGQPYTPTDYGDTPYLYQNLTIRQAVRISDNVVAVKWANVIGPDQVVRYAHLMGIDSPLAANLSIALGAYEVTPLEMAVGYSTLANGGNRVTPLSILRIKDRNGRIIEENHASIRQVVDPRVAYLMTDILTSVLGPGGTASFLSPIINRPAAGKTGTTENYRDAWFVGFTPDIVAAVYVGYDDPSVPVSAPGGRLAGPIWANFLRVALANVAPHDFARPPGLVDVVVCADSGLLPGYDCPTITEIFVSGTEPTTYDLGQGAPVPLPGLWIPPTTGSLPPPAEPRARPGRPRPPHPGRGLNISSPAYWPGCSSLTAPGLNL